MTTAQRPGRRPGPPRILHLFATFAAGGPQVRVARMINRWGDAVEHVVAAHDGRYDAQALIDPARPVALRRDFPFASRGALAQALRTADADLVCTYNWGAMDAVLANRFGGGRPLVHHDEGFGTDEMHRQKWQRVLFRRLAYPGANRIVVVSRGLQTIAREIWRQRGDKLVLLPNGIDAQAFAASPDPGSLPGFRRGPGEVVVGTVARLNAVKNLPLLVQALARVRRSQPQVRLVIVGEGEDRARIEHSIREQGQQDAVLLAGFVPEPQRYTGLFDIFALSSDSEQFPISLVEAMAAGLPCVATDVGDCLPMLAEANRELVVRAGDVQGLADSMLALATDGERRHRLGCANAERARSEYGFDRMMARYAALYGQVAGIAFPNGS